MSVVELEQDSKERKTSSYFRAAPNRPSPVQTIQPMDEEWWEETCKHLTDFITRISLDIAPMAVYAGAYAPALHSAATRGLFSKRTDDLMWRAAPRAVASSVAVALYTHHRYSDRRRTDNITVTNLALYAGVEQISHTKGINQDIRAKTHAFTTSIQTLQGNTHDGGPKRYQLRKLQSYISAVKLKLALHRHGLCHIPTPMPR